MNISDREKRTIRLASVFLGAYLVIYGGLQGYNWIQEKRLEVAGLEQELDGLKLSSERTKIDRELLVKLEKELNVPEASTSPQGNSLVAATLTSIEKIAGELGIQLGPHTELSSRQGSGEALRLNISGKGSLSSLSRFAEQLEAAPQPIVLRRLEFQRDNSKPGHAELTIHLGVLESQLLPEGGISDV